MARKMHGHAPRIRRRYNQNQDTTEVVIDEEELLNEIVKTAIGATVGVFVTNKILGQK